MTAVWAALAFGVVVTIARRVAYPYALEWMEGNQWYTAYRFARGLPVYGDPAETGFLPHPYPPVEPWCAAQSLQLFGMALWPGRLVSLVATAVATALIGWVVYRDDRNRIAAGLAACLFLGLYPLLDSWYDLIRVDMPFVALVLLGLAVWSAAPRAPRRALPGVVILAAATLAKQPALPILLLLSTWYVWRGGERRFWVVGTALATAFGLHAIIDLRSAGWYRYWVWQVPLHHRVAWRALVPGGLARAAAIAALPVTAAIVLRCAPSRERRGRTLRLAAAVFGDLWATALLVTFGVSAVTYAKVGATTNDWIPLAAVASVVFGRALSRRERLGGRVPVLVWSLLMGQALLCVRDPRALVPTLEDRLAGDRLVETIAAIPGEVYVMDDAYLAWKAGKTPSMGGMTLGDLAYAGEPTPPALLERLRRAQFTAVVLRYDATRERYPQPVSIALRAGYDGVKVEIPYRSERTFLPVAGGRYKPRWILFRREREPASQSAP